MRRPKPDRDFPLELYVMEILDRAKLSGKVAREERRQNARGLKALGLIRRRR